MDIETCVATVDLILDMAYSTYPHELSHTIYNTRHQVEIYLHGYWCNFHITLFDDGKFLSISSGDSEYSKTLNMAWNHVNPGFERMEIKRILIN